MVFKYVPNVGLEILGKKVKWNTHREKVRTILAEKFNPVDKVMDMSEYNDGSHDFDIHTRRDIYDTIDGAPCLFFLNYDKEDLLLDIELHTGVSVEIENILLTFDQNIETLKNKLGIISNDFVENEKGSFFSKNLKLVMISNYAMGGEGEEVGYLYMSKDVGHLDDTN